MTTTTKDPLMGLLMQVSFDRPACNGRRLGMVRRVKRTTKGHLVSVRLQLVGGERAVAGSTLSARYRGAEYVLSREELEAGMGCRVLTNPRSKLNGWQALAELED